MIGDSPQADIAQAIQSGWTSILVKTGIVTENDPEFPADYVVENFNEATELIWKLESLETIKNEKADDKDEKHLTREV